MDRDSGLNILYASTLDRMRIPKSSLRPCKDIFYWIIPGKEAVPLGHIRQNITFGSLDIFRKEPLTFEVVDFPGTYHTLLGRSCFTKFMAVPNYTYLKLKIPGPNRVITIEGSFEQTYYYDQDCNAQAVAISVSCGPNSSGHSARKAPLGEEAKAMALLHRSSLDEAPGATQGYDGSAGPSIQPLDSLEGADPIEVSFDHFLRGKAAVEPSVQ
ncbi:uncharacterized protein [Miscanthus floridulus]|uniref:uncharacterized protein n=1 Tax=Miscanthus floridulus TaxID=154761 RepID=UPI00345AAE2D